jgi:hypothetical protein
MTWIKTILREVYGLFVDDLKFALAIIFWIALVRLIFPHISITPAWRGFILFAGLALILAENAALYARSRRSNKP